MSSSSSYRRREIARRASTKQEAAMSIRIGTVRTFLDRFVRVGGTWHAGILREGSVVPRNSPSLPDTVAHGEMGERGAARFRRGRPRVRRPFRAMVPRWARARIFNQYFSYFGVWLEAGRAVARRVPWRNRSWLRRTHQSRHGAPCTRKCVIPWLVKALGQ